MGNKRAKKIAVIDAETDPFDGETFVQPFIWGFYDGDEFLTFTSTEDLALHLIGLTDTIVYAHNGGKFDFHLGLMQYANPFQSLNIINGRIARFMIGDCELRDSVCILPISLAQYQKDEISYDIFYPEEREKPENWKKIVDYLKGDCVYLHDLINKFTEKYGQHLTLAGAAFSFWEKMSEQKPPESDGNYYEFLTPYYYGGRVECFAKGVENIDFEFYDINSAYPYAMLHQHPTSTEYYVDDEPTQADIDDLMERGIFGPCLVSIRAISRGALPVRMAKKKLDGEDSAETEMYFPNDNVERVYHVTGWEILAGIETGTLDIKEWLTVIEFEELGDFSQYIYHFYNERLEAKANGDKANDIFCKLFMNSLYGRYAMNSNKFHTFINIPPEYMPCIGEPLDERLEPIVSDPEYEKFNPIDFQYAGELSIYSLIKRNLYDYEKTFYNIATSASITGFVRAYMWKHICQTKGTIYCDTDSIAAESFHGFKEGKELGEWDKEGEFTQFAVAGKKLYAFEYVKETGPVDAKTGEKKTHKIASKGVAFTAEEIIRVAQGEAVTFKPQVPTYSYHKNPVFTSRTIRANAKTAKDRALDQIS